MEKKAPYLFADCINLGRITLMQAVMDAGQTTSVQPREVPQGCFGSSGLSDFKLPPDFDRLGAHACENCKVFAFVDLSSTSIVEIREFTFAHCIRLQRIWLPNTLQTIHAEASMNCAILQELAIPPTLLYVANKAFLDCTLWHGSH